MDAVRIVKAQDSAIVHAGQIWKQKGEVITNDFALIVDPNFFAKDAETTCTPEMSFVIRYLEKSGPLTH